LAETLTPSVTDLQAETFQALLDIAAAISGELDPARLAQLAVDRAGLLLGADAAHLWLWEEAQGVLRSLARSDACLLTGAEEVEELGESIVSQAFRRREPVVVHDYQSWGYGLPLLVASGVKSAMGVPLLVNERPVGSFVVHNYDYRRFGEQQVQLLRLFAAQVAPALEAARLHMEAERRRGQAEQAEAQVRELNAELERRVRERTAELEAANRELEAFSYSVSHDLRAPLRGMDGFCQVLLEDYGDRLDEEGRDHLHRVRSASQHMARLIDDLLKLSRVTRTELRRDKINLSRIAHDIAASLQSAEPERQVSWIIADGLVGEGDRRLLRVVLENLLGNAWKFTSKHLRSTIEFGCSEMRGAMTYFVRDDGAGFNMAYTDKLFGPFQRLHGMQEFEGNGVGLATVQRIISRHGGRVWAEGEVERGACFFFTL